MHRPRSRNLWFASAVVAGAVWMVGGLHAVADSHEKTSAADVGRSYYLQYCAACHGQDARGAGEFADLMKAAPPNLTTIAERRGGTFPSLEIAEMIDGSKVRAHGSSEMPIWGERFAEGRPSGQGGRTALRGRVMLLVEYLRGIQTDVSEIVPEPAPEAPAQAVVEVGREQFEMNCAACHGLEGKGDGYVGVLLENPPADLTTIAARRGGSFPALEVAEIVDGRREIKAHGTREMPVWGDRLGEHMPPSMGKQSAVRGEVMLYVEFLRSLQAP